MNKKVIVMGSKVQRLEGSPRGLRRHLTVRNAIGLTGILAFAVWMFNMLGGR